MTDEQFKLMMAALEEIRDAVRARGAASHVFYVNELPSAQVDALRDWWRLHPSYHVEPPHKPLPETRPDVKTRAEGDFWLSIFTG